MGTASLVDSPLSRQSQAADQVWSKFVGGVFDPFVLFLLSSFLQLSVPW